MSTQTPVDKTSPLWLAWEAYKSTPEYQNTRRWALVEYAVDGSLWAAFERGFAASRDTLVSPAPQHVDAVERLTAIRDRLTTTPVPSIRRYLDEVIALLRSEVVSPAPETDLVIAAVIHAYDQSGNCEKSTGQRFRFWCFWNTPNDLCGECAGFKDLISRHLAGVRNSEVVAPPPPAVDLEGKK